MKRCYVIFMTGLLWLYLLLFQVDANLEPGYLDFDNLPDTNFSCIGKVIGGYYADLEANCQMFHVCTIGQMEEPMDIRFLCLNGTVFDQETRVCERVDEVDCANSEKFYSLNLELYGNTAPALVEAPETKESPQQSTTTSTTTPPSTTAQQETTTTPSYHRSTTSVRPTEYILQTPSITTTRQPSKSHFQLHQLQHPYSTTVSPTSHHFSIDDDDDSDINVNPITPPKIHFQPPSSQQPPVSYQQNNYNGIEQHITVTTHTAVYKDHRIPITNARNSTPIRRPPASYQSHMEVTTRRPNYNIPHDVQRGSPHPFKFRPSYDPSTLNRSTSRYRPSTTTAEPLHQQSHYDSGPSSSAQTTKQQQSHNIFKYRPEEDPSDLRYHFHSTNPPQYLPQRLSLIESEEDLSSGSDRNDRSDSLGESDDSGDDMGDASDEDDEDLDSDEETELIRVQHPHGHSIQEFTSTKRLYHDTNTPQQNIKANDATSKATSPNLKTEKPPNLQIPLPLPFNVPFNIPSPFTLRDHYETKRHNQKPRVIVSATATISDTTGRKLNITLGTISQKLVDTSEESGDSDGISSSNVYDDYKDDDIKLDPFAEDLLKVHQKPTNSGGITQKSSTSVTVSTKRKRNIVIDYDYVNDNYEPETYKEELIVVTHPSKMTETMKNTTHLIENTMLVLEPANEAIHEIENATKSKYIDNKILDMDDDLPLYEDDLNDTSTEFLINLTNSTIADKDKQISTNITSTSRHFDNVNNITNKNTGTHALKELSSPIPSIMNNTVATQQKQHLIGISFENKYNFNDREHQVQQQFHCTVDKNDLHKFYSDENDCRMFHYCAPGFENTQILHLKFICDVGTYFNIETKRCEIDRPINCLLQ